MHVAQFIHRYPPALGGAESYTARLCDFLVRSGHEVDVWTTTAIALDELWKGTSRIRAEQAQVGVARGLSVHRYSPLHFPARRYILKALSLLPLRPWQCLTVPCNPICPDMWRDAGQYKGALDAVHATAFPYAFPILCARRLARRRGVPFFVTPFLHLGDLLDKNDRTRKQYTAPYLRWLLHQADGVFVQTRAEFDAVIRLGLPESRVHLQGLGVDRDECTGGNRGAARREWKVLPREIIVGHLANNSAEKGTVDLLKAAEQCWSHGEQFRLALAGPEMSNFRDFWSRYRAKERVIRLGVLDEEQKRDFFAAIDLFALPSRTDSFGLVLLEAWANGKPNLVYRAGGPGELVHNNRDGLQVPCGDIDAMAVQLSRLVRDAGLRQALGQRGRERIAREFRWQDKLELVQRTLEEGKRRSMSCKKSVRASEPLIATSE